MIIENSLDGYTLSYQLGIFIVVGLFVAYYMKSYAPFKVENTKEYLMWQFKIYVIIVIITLIINYLVSKYMTFNKPVVRHQY